MSDNSGSYVFIGGVTAERGGVQVNPQIDPTYFTTPTLSFTNFAKAVSAAFSNVAPGSKLVNKANGTQYAIPIFTNA